MNKFIFILCFFFSTELLAQSIPADTMAERIRIHFTQYKAEYFRYGGLTMYGETETKFSATQINLELSLFEQTKKSDLINQPTGEVFGLCHNLLIHSPEKGKELLQLINKPTENKEIINYLFSAFIFTGEYGEQAVLKNLQSTDARWRLIWSRYLKTYAVYDSSIPQIKKTIEETMDTEIKANLISALMCIANTSSVEYVKQIIDTTQNDEILTKSIFVYTELVGYDALEYLKGIKPVGEGSKEELASSITWLKENTNEKDKFGTEIKNDLNFVNRYGDISSPAIVWLDKKGLLTEKRVLNPEPFTKTDKATFFKLLIESKVFGLEAAKENLFLSLDKADLDELYQLRMLCYYSPNSFTKGRINTIGIMIRYVRKL